MSSSLCHFAARRVVPTIALIGLVMSTGCQRDVAPTNEVPPLARQGEPAAVLAASADEAANEHVTSGSVAGVGDQEWTTCGGECTTLGYDLMARGEVAAAVRTLAMGCVHGELAACSGFDMHADRLCESPDGVAKIGEMLRCPELSHHCFIRSEIALHCQDDASEALAMAEAGCELNDMPSCQQIGEFQMTTLNEPENGVRRFQIACERGYAQGCYRSALGGIENPTLFQLEPERIRELFGLACEMGQTPACARLRAMQEAR